jgi:hypothetical protein
MLHFIVNESEAARWLLNRKAAVVLGIAAVLSVGVIVLWLSDFSLAALSPIEGEIISWSAVAFAAGALCLWAAMLLFWLRCDASHRLSRKIWLIALVVGVIGTIPYYLFVYLPAVRRKLRDHAGAERNNSLIPVHSDPESGTAEPTKRRKLFGPFGWALVIGWILLLLTVAASFTFPRAMSHLLRPVADYFVLWPTTLILGSMTYALISLFRLGINRSSNSSAVNRSKHP